MNSFFKLKSDTGAATAEGADVITKYATWVVPWWKTGEQTAGVGVGEGPEGACPGV